MLHQFQTEETKEQTYTPLTVPQTELTNQQTHDTKNTQAVHAWMAQIQRKALRAKRRFWITFICLEAAGFIPSLFPGFVPYRVNESVNLPALWLPFMPAIIMLLLAARTFLTKPSWNAEELARIGGVEAVGTLIDLLGAPKAPRQMTPLYVALTELLPQMKASDATLLNAGQRRLLYWTLKNGYGMTTSPAVYQNFRLAVLKAMEQIGDADAVPIVEHLANGGARTAHQKALKAAAIECLPLLLVNFGSVEASKTLLRPSAPEQSPPELLLHPAEFTPDANPKQLLHAADTASSPPPIS